MKLEKITIDGKEYFQICEEKEYDLEESISTSECEKNSSKLGTGAREIGKRIISRVKDVGLKIKCEAEKLFAGGKESGYSEIVKLLRYMPKDEAHTAALELSADGEVLENIGISPLMPYLETLECDALLLRALDLPKVDLDLDASLKHVSPGCVSEIAKKYISGKIEGIKIDTLYPYLSENDASLVYKKLMEI